MSLKSARVVGAGSIGSRYLRVLAGLSSSMPIIVPVSGVLRNPELSKLARLEQFNKFPRTTVQLCVIATNTDRHVPDSMEFVNHCEVLLIEKPLAPSVAATQGLDISSPSTRVSVATPLRFMEAFGFVRDNLTSLGVITGVSVQSRSWLPSWRPGTNYQTSYSSNASSGGVLLDLVHEIDYCLQLFGDPKELGCSLRHRSILDIDSESSAHMVWIYDGFDIDMVLDYTSRPPKRMISIYGSQKSVEWDLLTATVKIWNHATKDAAVSTFLDDLDRDQLLARQILATVASVRDFRLSTVRDAFKAVTICDLAKLSSNEFGVRVDSRDALAVHDVS